MAMYFLPDDISVFYLAWALIPVCGLGLWPVSYLRLTAGWFDRRLGFALGVANSGIGVGTVIVPPAHRLAHRGVRLAGGVPRAGGARARRLPRRVLPPRRTGPAQGGCPDGG
ncbi:hypothetical protein GCM10020295_76120 [Streptomyces cinereospinus]